MPIIRRQLKPADVYPEDIRYNELTDEFETFINGEWTPNPEGDPRHKTVYPPRTTSDTRCDAAESVKAAFKGQIDGILTAIDNGATAFAIAGTILSLFSFGVFGVFISLALFIADAMLSAGTTALEAALTETAWDTFACILYCNMDSQGRLSAAAMDTVVSEVTDQIGGLAAGIMNSMLNLAGEGGVNNLASIGSSTGDCSECDCGTPCIDPDKWTGGTVISQTENPNGSTTFIVEATLKPNSTYHIEWGIPDSEACCCIIDFEVTEGNCSAPAAYFALCGSPTVDTSTTFPPDSLCYAAFQQNGCLTTPFTVSITFDGCP